MSWKPLDEIYLKESAGKQIPILPRQQVFKEATAKEVIALINDLDEQGLLKDGDDLQVVMQYLGKKPFQEKISTYLTKQNLTPTTISEGNIQEKIMDTLASHNDISQYSKYIESPAKLASLGNRGMLIEKGSQITGLKEETIRDLINLIGTESGRGVGRAEIALATLFDDVRMSEGKGDLDWNGEYLEVKATSARLGKRDRASTNFNNTSLGQLALQSNITDKRIDNLVANIANTPNVNQEQLRNSLEQFLKTEYPHNNLDIVKQINLKDPVAVRKGMTQIYFNNYAMGEGVASFIFVNTSGNRYFSRFTLFTKDQISSLIDQNVIKSGVITTLDLDPSLGTI